MDMSGDDGARVCGTLSSYEMEDGGRIVGDVWDVGYMNQQQENMIKRARGSSL